MKNFILGFASALVLVVIIYFGYPFIGGFFSRGPVSPEMLKPGILDYGALKVTVLGNGQPLSDVEVDLGNLGKQGPSGPFIFQRTDGEGAAFFEKVPVGMYDIFWNDYFFPKEYVQPDKISVEIIKGETTKKIIELQLRQ